MKKKKQGLCRVLPDRGMRSGSIRGNGFTIHCETGEVFSRDIPEGVGLEWVMYWGVHSKRPSGPPVETGRAVVEMIEETVGREMLLFIAKRFAEGSRSFVFQDPCEWSVFPG